MYICIVDHNLRDNELKKTRQETCIGDCMVFTRNLHELLIANQKEPRAYIESNKNLAGTWRSSLLTRKKPQFFKVYNLRGSDKNRA